MLDLSLRNLRLGPARERPQLTPEEVRAQEEAGVLVLDGRRSRPRYFDGRFLAARDLTREQTYFLSRQADLGRAAGTGVALGLMVAPTETGAAAGRLEIGAGYGLTDAGELVALPDPVSVDLKDIARIGRLDAAFGLGRIARESPRGPTGLFVVALRPVEFTANPIAAYPTSLTGQRTVEDGDIVEATAVVLFPFPVDPGAGPGGARARAAYDLFVAGGERRLPADVLPLAVLSLSAGAVEWVDPFLVRREVGAERGGPRGLGFARRATREAHLTQYDAHLADVLAGPAAGRGRFAAADHFLALPPAGRLPAAAVDPAALTQTFFPPEVDVELSIVPDDELAALVEESLLLPPFDLTAGSEALESSAALILVPTPRWQVQRLRGSLAGLTRRLRPAAPGLIARRRPLEALELRLPRLLPPPVPAPTLGEDDAWRQALATIEPAGQLWYVRRRHLAHREDLVGLDLILFGDLDALETELNARVVELQLGDLMETLRARLGEGGPRAEVLSFLASAAFERSPVLLAGPIWALSQRAGADPLTETAVREVWGEYSGAGFGEGILKLEAATPDLRQPERAATVARSDRVPQLDRLGRALAPAPLADLARRVAETAAVGDPVPVRTLIDQEFGEIR